MDETGGVHERDGVATAVRLVWNATMFVAIIISAVSLHVWLDPSLPATHHGESASGTIEQGVVAVGLYSAPILLAFLVFAELAGRRALHARLSVLAAGLGAGSLTLASWIYGGAGAASALAIPLWLGFGLIVVLPAASSNRARSDRLAPRLLLALSIAVIGVAGIALASVGTGTG